MGEYILTEDAAKTCLWELASLDLHRSFPGYLGLKWASSKAGTTTDFQFDYNEFFDTFFKVREPEIGKPYVIPFNSDDDPDGNSDNMWLQSNCAGSFGPSSPSATFQMMYERVDGTGTSADWELVDDYWTVARDGMLDGTRIPVDLIAGFLLRDFVIEMDEPGADGLVEAFRDEFGYDEGDSDYTSLYMTGGGYIDADSFEEYDGSTGSGSGIDGTTSSVLHGKARDLTDIDLGLRVISTHIELSDSDFDAIEDKTSLGQDKIEELLASLNRKKQAIFYGPPGTGKTYLAKELARQATADTDGFWDIVQFHQSYEYTDFIQGIRPTLDDDGDDLSYEMAEGAFKEFCDKADDRAQPCVLIIDEINRADVSQVFGELMYLLEYRSEEVQLAQHTEEDDGFEIPENVFILGTMNTADRSIALVDFALRRRFAFMPLRPNYQVLRDHYEDSDLNIESLIETLEDINDAIDDQNFEIGFTYFLGIDLEEDLENVWQYEIVPYLEEYFIDNPSTVNQYRWNNVDIDLESDD